MISEKQLIKISKFLSLVLRHKPDIIEIQLDNNGWTNVKELIAKSKSYGVQFDEEIVKYIIDTNSKKRFAFNENGDKIRASQGHSVNVELDYQNQKPPTILYHGTSEKSIRLILNTGLQKRNRQHVHLSSDIETAIKVGQRHGKPFVLEVLAEQMYKAGFAFYLSDNNVWLTDSVPVIYLKQIG